MHFKNPYLLLFIMFIFKTTNSTYKTNTINQLKKFSNKTNKEIMNRVIPVKVQKAFDQWLEAHNSKEIQEVKVLTDKEKQALPMYFDENVEDTRKFYNKYITRNNPLNLGIIKTNQTTDDKFYVETENNLIYEAFRENSQSQCVIITDKDLRDKPFVTTMQDNLMEGELRIAFDQWFDQDFSQEELNRRDKHIARIEREGNEITVDDVFNWAMQVYKDKKPTAHKINVNCSDVKSSVQVKIKNNWFKDFYNSNLFIGAFVLSITLLACAFWMWIKM